MKKVITVALSAMLAAASLAGCSSSSSGSAASTSSKKTYKVTIVKQLDHTSLDQIADAITDELDALARKNNVTIDYGEVQSGQNDQTTIKQITDGAVTDGADAIVPIATLAAQTAVVSAEDSNIPVVYAAVSDPEAAKLTGLKNVTGTSDALNTKQIIDMMFSVNPDIKNVGLLYSKSETNSTKAIEEAREYLKKKGIDNPPEATGNTNDEVLTAVSSLISDHVDAVFTPTDNVVMAAAGAVSQELTEAGIPFYAGADSFVTSGAFATCGVNYDDLGKKTADLVYQVMTEGFKDVDDYYTMDGGIVTVNTDTARALGIDYSSFSDFGKVVEVTTSEN